MGLTGTYGEVSREQALRVLAHAIDLGVAHIDTAATYGDGENERRVAAAIRHRRGKVFIATKCGVRYARGRLIADGRPESVVAGVHESLRRLDVETIDLMYLHRADPDVPIEESIGALDELRRRGDIRGIGLSEVSPGLIRRAADVAQIDALQSEYSLMTRELEGETIDLLRERGIPLVAYSPLARGLLVNPHPGLGSLAADDFRRSIPRFQGSNLAHNTLQAQALVAVAEAHEAEPAQIALAWVMARDHDVVPIPGTTRVEALTSNAAAARLTLARDEIDLLSEAFPPGVARGRRSAESPE